MAALSGGNALYECSLVYTRALFTQRCYVTWPHFARGEVHVERKRHKRDVKETQRIENQRADDVNADEEET